MSCLLGKDSVIYVPCDGRLDLINGNAKDKLRAKRIIVYGDDRSFYDDPVDSESESDDDDDFKGFAQASPYDLIVLHEFDDYNKLLKRQLAKDGKVFVFDSASFTTSQPRRSRN